MHGVQPTANANPQRECCSRPRLDAGKQWSALPVQQGKTHPEGV
jgi:hypothetical protein